MPAGALEQYAITPLLSQGSHGALCGFTGTVIPFDFVLVGCHECSLGGRWGVVHHMPFDDNANGVDDATWNRLLAATKAIPPQASVLTVCSMGENRSGLLSAMVLHHRGVKDVIDLIRSRVVPRTDQPYALWNPGFVRQIRERLES